MVRTGLISLGILIIAIIGFFIFSRMNKNKKEGFAPGDNIIAFNFTNSLDKEKPICIFIDKSDNSIIYSNRNVSARLSKIVISGNNATSKAFGPTDSTTITTNFETAYIVKDSTGAIYFQSGNNINKLVLSTGVVSTIAGNGNSLSLQSPTDYKNTASDTTTYTDNVPATSVSLAIAQWGNIPLAIDSNNIIYIFETTIIKENNILKLRKLTLQQDGTYNISVFRITLPSDIHNTITFPTGTSTLTNVVEMTFGANNILYIACTYHIFKVELNSNTEGRATLYAGSKTSTTPTSTGDEGDAKSATFKGIISMALDSFENLYVSDDKIIRKIDIFTNIITTYLKKDMVGLSPADNAAIPANFPLKKLSFDSLDNLYSIYGWGIGTDPRIIKIPSPCRPGENFIREGTDSYCSYIRHISRLPRNTKGKLKKATENIVRVDPSKTNDPNTFIYKWAGIEGPISANPCKNPPNIFFNFDNLTCEATGNPVTAPVTGPVTAQTRIGTAPTCSKGQQYNLANQQCEACPAGSYQDLTNGNKCKTSCNPGMMPNSAKDGCTKVVNCCPTPENKSYSHMNTYYDAGCGPRYFNAPILKPITRFSPAICKKATIANIANKDYKECFEFQRMFKTPCINLPATTSGFEDMDVGETVFSKRQQWFENRRLLNSA